MEFQDRVLECTDCHQSFTFTAGEQEFYDRKGFKEVPKRCKSCRENRKVRRSSYEHEAAGGEMSGNRREFHGASGGGYGGGNRGGGGGGGREMFDAVCAACGAPARVPFRPAAGRPVYCRDCYANRSAGNG